MPELLVLAEYVPMTEGLLDKVTGVLPLIAKLGGGVGVIVGAGLGVRALYLGAKGGPDGVPR